MLINLEALKCIPVKFNTVSRTVWCDGHAVTHFQTVSHIFFKTKAVHFQIGRIWRSGKQMNVNIMRPMRCNRQAMSLSKMCYLHENGDTTTCREVGFRKIYTTRRDE